jgi:hypothetical protein
LRKIWKKIQDALQKESKNQPTVQNIEHLANNSYLTASE